jgi:hypothetical protein
MWEQVKAILEENYATRRMIFYCACKKFSRRHDKDEKIWSLGSKVDQMQSELRLATSNVCTSKELKGASTIWRMCVLFRGCRMGEFKRY